MRKPMIFLGGILAGLFFVVLFLVGCSIFSRSPQNLGPLDGKLLPCPESPNCVCSLEEQNDAVHFIEPIVINEDPDEALVRLEQVIRDMPRAKIITLENDYMHVEFTSRVFRFVDDVEFLLDRKASLIHVRSASRAGHSDLGVNRNRVESIRARLTPDAI